MQPTGGVLLVVDKNPSEPKNLIELKARKNVKVAAAPAPHPTGLDSLRGDPALRQAMALSQGAPHARDDVAGVLTSVDEDPEGGEEAEVPREFDYYSDEEDNGGDAMES